MKTRQVLFCTLALLATSSRRVRENPLGKVIQLLDDLTAKITNEGEAEAKAFKEYAEWCDDTQTDTKYNIETLTTEQGKLQASIAKLTSDAEASQSAVEGLAAKIATDESDLKDATAVREKETADFAASEKELLDVVSTLTRASAIIAREMHKNPAAFAQMDRSGYAGVIRALDAIVEAAVFPADDKQRLVALVQAQEDTDDDNLGAPAGAVYKSHSGGILDTLEDLKEKAEEQLAELRKAETNANHNFNMLKQSLDDSIAADTKDLGEEKIANSAALEGKATASGDLNTCVGSLAKAKTQLESATAECMQVAADHEATVAARADELKAIADAKTVLADTSSGAVSQTYSMFQLGRAARSGSRMQSRVDLKNAEILTLVKELAQKHHSTALAQLASRIGAVLKYGAGADEDPFAKIKGLISDMISRLEAQAGAEATEKAYCDEQTAKTEEKKGELEYDISKLTSKIDTTAARSAGLKQDVKGLQAELAKLAKLQAEMDKIRTESHAAYVQAKADLELGLGGVRNALSVLRDYYSDAPQESLLQSAGGLGAAMQQPEKPATFSKATGAGTSIIGILEVVESDFAKNLAAEETEEADAQADYEKTTQLNAIEKADKDQSVKYKTQEFTEADKAVAELSKDRETEQAELGAVMEYYGKIKERCIAKPETYENRRARRAAEIAGLKQALKILETEAALLQRPEQKH